jgi:hypothetical protein
MVLIEFQYTIESIPFARNGLLKHLMVASVIIAENTHYCRH